MYLFFDTETTGLPRNWRAPVTDLNNWPRMVQIAWILSEGNGTHIEAGDFIIKPENFVIPLSTSKVHGITTAKALREGKDLREILLKFNELVDEAEFLVAHNISFDEKILGAELLRKNIQSNFFKKKNCVPCRLQLTIAGYPALTGSNGPNCRNCTPGCSGWVLMRLIMPLLTSAQQKSVSGK